MDKKIEIDAYYGHLRRTLNYIQTDIDKCLAKVDCPNNIIRLTDSLRVYRETLLHYYKLTENHSNVQLVESIYRIDN